MASPYPFTQNRELSWLKFNERVLEEAADPRVPLLERLKFVAIFTSNLDEFFMVRCGSIYDLSLVKPGKKDKRSGMTPGEELAAIYREVRKLYPRKDEVLQQLNRNLTPLHMARLPHQQFSKKDRKYLTNFFADRVYPMLSPQIIDVHHPFPHLANKALYVLVHLEVDHDEKYGIVPVPDFLDRVVPLPDEGGNYTLLEYLIYNEAGQLFPGMKIRAKTIIRVTRNADINLDESEIKKDTDYRDFMKSILHKRNRLAPIRLEYYKEMDERTEKYLLDHLRLSKDQVFCANTSMDMGYVNDMIDQHKDTETKTLLYPPYQAQPTPELDQTRPLIPQVLNHDALLFYPYQDISAYLKLLEEAAHDRNVVAIKITIYRLAKHSKVVRALCDAAENGKEVIVLMELRARFDESHNIEEAKVLEEAGCTIIYGFDDFKVHSKVTQITLKRRKGLKYITQIGTGNYNEKTSHFYTDLSYITARDNIGRDAAEFFRNLQIGNMNGNYDCLLVSPFQLKEHVIAMIDEQIEAAKTGQPAQILLKMNSVTDVDLIKKLQEASQAGVYISLIVRGICCILPGVPGYTENIHIRSIVGRFLEHSRIYCFGTGKDIKVYIASADFMTRNTERRVEVGCPIYDDTAKKQILEYYDSQLKDNVKARILQPDGTYTKVKSEAAPYDSQEAWMKFAEQEAKKIKQPHPTVFQTLLHRLRHS
ncbi:polyphosphate kinase 1 [Lactobacillus corticis]|uniref:Polyphosphate kinase n=1 Tax=Lactobacillus corticis TaxID=2201249 RepID=A0A916QGG5_9LACO|nr:polyphosphate kinase 1 [Lactobacillus corticis]GFZ26854.1 polyphosphate kinase [Lactobacillus corticis]